MTNETRLRKALGALFQYIMDKEIAGHFPRNMLVQADDALRDGAGRLCIRPNDVISLNLGESQKMVIVKKALYDDRGDGDGLLWYITDEGGREYAVEDDQIGILVEEHE